MKPVERSEIVDYQTYEDIRGTFRAEIFNLKRDRRVHVGEHLTFLFENHETIRYQVQEMMRAEKIVRDADIQHEIDTYNELLGGPGQLGCTLLIEIDDVQTRQDKLTAWLDLPRHLYALLDDGTRVKATYDSRQVGETRVSSVQYLSFEVGGRTPIALGADHPDLTIETPLTGSQRAALSVDLAD
jgi:hypothetical protein